MSFKYKLPLLFSIILLALVGCNPVQRTATSIELSYDTNQPLRVGSIVDVDFSVDTVPSTKPFSIVVLPDTQYYSQKYPHIFLAQTEWIAEHHEELNLAFVTHVGDIVQHDDEVEEQWLLADEAMGKLDGVVPYGVLPGNHDMQRDGTADSLPEILSRPHVLRSMNGGVAVLAATRTITSCFQPVWTISLTLHLQFCTTDEAIVWAKDVIEQHADRRVIISTHAYIETGGYRTPNCIKNTDGTNNAIDVWRELVAPYENVELVLSGHIPGVGQRIDTIDLRTIYQLLADYQGMEEGGSGYLRIMRFYPLEDVIRVETYSPYLDAYMTDPENEFEFPYQLADAGEVAGEVIISAGEASCTASIAQGSCAITLGDAGIQSITAEYQGFENFAPSSTEISITIDGE